MSEDTQELDVSGEDSHAYGQKPISYIRQVASVALNQDLLECPDFATDVKDQVRRFLADCSGASLGSYSDDCGIPLIQQDIAAFLQKRDEGIPSDPDNIIFTEGISEAVIQVLKFVNQPRDGKPTGVLVPVPQCPLYSNVLAVQGMTQIDYFLDENDAWAINISELRRAVTDARQHCNPSFLVVINPGNPSGQVLTELSIRQLIQFASEEGLFILADEVYQEIVYRQERPFHSFKKIMSKMEAPYNATELISFYSASKSLVAECGVRAGFMEVMNLDPQVWPMLRKAMVVSHPNTVGQVVMDCIVHPPIPGMPSYEAYQMEMQQILDSLTEKATLVVESLNSIAGVHCSDVQGGVSAFPRLEFPTGLIDKANSLGMHPDAYYAQQLLADTGIRVVPGSSLGEKPNTFHFRLSILPSLGVLTSVLERLKDFHLKFIKAYTTSPVTVCGRTVLAQQPKKLKT